MLQRELTLTRARLRGAAGAGERVDRRGRVRTRPAEIRSGAVSLPLLVPGCTTLPAPASGLIAAAVGVSGPRVPGVAP